MDKIINIHSIKDIEQKNLAVVDFWSNRCTSCRILSAVLEEVASRVQEGVSFYKLNTLENAEEAEKMGVMSLPTLIFFREGHEVARHTGIISKEKLQKLIEENK